MYCLRCLDSDVGLDLIGFQACARAGGAFHAGVAGANPEP